MLLLNKIQDEKDLTAFNTTFGLDVKTLHVQCKCLKL